jgi:hypothetical protein
MAEDELFDDLPKRPAPQAFDAGRPRLREPVRNQIELRAVDLDGLIGADHPARVRPPPARDCCWRCGFMRPAKASEAPGLWPGCAKVMTPIAGCAAG